MFNIWCFVKMDQKGFIWKMWAMIKTFSVFNRKLSHFVSCDHCKTFTWNVHRLWHFIAYWVNLSEWEIWGLIDFCLHSIDLQWNWLLEIMYLIIMVVNSMQCLCSRNITDSNVSLVNFFSFGFLCLLDSFQTWHECRSFVNSLQIELASG